MTTEEKLEIAWIALDGFLWRNFLTHEEYESDKKKEIAKSAFRPYHRFITIQDRTAQDFLTLLHFQNIVEANLRSGRESERLRKLLPAELTAEIAQQASLDIVAGHSYSIFTPPAM